MAIYGNSHLTGELWLELRLLADMAGQWLLAWNSFGERARLFQAYLDGVLQGRNDTQEMERARAIQELLQPLITHSAQGILAPQEFPPLLEPLGHLVRSLTQAPDYRKPGALYSELHGKLESLIYLIAQAPDGLHARASRCLSLLDQKAGESSEESEAYRAAREATDAVRAAALSLDITAMSMALASLQQAVACLPPPPSALPCDDHYPIPSGRDWVLVAVEDDPLWERTIKNVTSLLELHLGSDYSIRLEIRSDRASAQEFLTEWTRRTPASARTVAPQRLLAILDIGIPEQAGGKPSRDAGIALLRFVREPMLNIPAVVLTTAPNFLGDHLIAHEVGVTDYLLKEVDSDEILLEALLRIVTARPARAIRLLEDTERTIKIDDVEVNLEPAVFRTISVFVDEATLYHAPRPITPERVVELLDGKYGGYIRWPSLEQGAEWINRTNFWRRARRETRSATEAVGWLHDNCPLRLWRSIEAELRGNDIPADRWNSVAAYLEERYGGIVTDEDDYSPENIEKHVYQARDAIKRAFNAVGKSILPEEEVLINTMAGDQFAYKLVATIVSDENAPSVEVTSPRCRVLVVENDVDNWLRPVELLLIRYGYEVRCARHKQEAVAIAREFQPDILCLDMELPLDEDSFIRDPLGGDVHAGLDVLQKVSVFVPEVRALVLTDFANRDDLRQRANDLGVRVSDFVPKRDSAQRSWRTDLVLKMHRIEQEIRRQAILPLPSVPYLPAIHLWRDRRDERYLEVFGKPWKSTPNQFKLLWTLAEHDNRPVPAAKLIEAVYGERQEQHSSQFDESLKQLVKNIRKKITTEWFDGSDPEITRDLGVRILANDAKHGYLLNARIMIE